MSLDTIRSAMATTVALGQDIANKPSSLEKLQEKLSRTATQRLASKEAEKGRAHGLNLLEKEYGLRASNKDTEMRTLKTLESEFEKDQYQENAKRYARQVGVKVSKNNAIYQAAKAIGDEKTMAEFDPANHSPIAELEAQLQSGHIGASRMAGLKDTESSNFASARTKQADVETKDALRSSAMVAADLRNQMTEEEQKWLAPMLQADLLGKRAGVSLTKEQERASKEKSALAWANVFNDDKARANLLEEKKRHNMVTEKINEESNRIQELGIVSRSGTSLANTQAAERQVLNDRLLSENKILIQMQASKDPNTGKPNFNQGDFAAQFQVVNGIRKQLGEVPYKYELVENPETGEMEGNSLPDEKEQAKHDQILQMMFHPKVMELPPQVIAKEWFDTLSKEFPGQEKAKFNIAFSQLMEEGDPLLLKTVYDQFANLVNPPPPAE